MQTTDDPISKRARLDTNPSGSFLPHGNALPPHQRINIRSLTGPSPTTVAVRMPFRQPGHASDTRAVTPQTNYAALPNLPAIHAPVQPAELSTKKNSPVEVVLIDDNSNPPTPPKEPEDVGDDPLSLIPQDLPPLPIGFIQAPVPSRAHGPVSRNRAPAPRHKPRAPVQPRPLSGVIDLCDEDAIPNLQPVQGFSSRLEISRGGGMFLVQPSGQVEIVDSDDEEQVVRNNRLVYADNGMYSLPANSSRGNTQPIMDSTKRTSQPQSTDRPAGSTIDSMLVSDPLSPVSSPVSDTAVTDTTALAATAPATTISTTSDPLARFQNPSAPGLRLQHPHLNAISGAHTSAQNHAQLTYGAHRSQFSSTSQAPPQQNPFSRAQMIQRIAMAQRHAAEYDRKTSTSRKRPAQEMMESYLVGAQQAMPIQATTNTASSVVSNAFAQRYPLAGQINPVDPFNFPPLPVRDHSYFMSQIRTQHALAFKTGRAHLPQPLPIPLHEDLPQKEQVDKNALSYSKQSSIGDREIEVNLRELVKRNELTADATEEAPTPVELNVELMPHQRRALAWMAKREEPIETEGDNVVAVDEDCLGGILADDQGLGKTLTMIALLCKKSPKATAEDKLKRNVEMKASTERDDKSDDDMDIKLSSAIFRRGHSGTKPEGVQRGDDKMQVDPPDAVLKKCRSRLKAEKKKGVRRGKPWRTLIVCPVSLINQWKSEIESRMEEQYRPVIHLYHGPRRERNPKVLEQCDVVLTTYPTLALEYPKPLKDHEDYERLKKEKRKVPCRPQGAVFDVKWHRVVLDEAQYVKNRGTDSWSAVMSLNSRKRWCMTGTPIQNSVDDLYSMFCFIRYKFVKNYHVWNVMWKKKLENSRPEVREGAFKRFQTVVGVVLLRRTKGDTINGNPLIDLPGRTTVLLEPVFQDPEEESVYCAVRDKSVVQFSKYLLDGSVLSNYRNILLMLLRLRQACSHPFLIQYANLHRTYSLSSSKIDQYATPFPEEELKEAIELITGGHPHLDLIESSSRDRVSAFLKPPPKGEVDPSRFFCQYCKREEGWTQGAFLPCGHIFCEPCCGILRTERKCMVCMCTIEDPTVSEVFVCPNDLRREVHAKFVLSNGVNPVKSCTPTEFRKWVKEELKERVQSKSQGSAKVESDIPPNSEMKDISAGKDNAGQVANERSQTGPTDTKDEQSQRQRLISAFTQPSTKIRQVLHRLSEIQKKDGNEKTLIFSQWTSMLDIVEFQVRVRGYDCCRLDGSMTPAARQDQVNAFRSNEKKTVFLISLHAGGTGLNLTEACNVILCDVWWNPAAEDQAIDRVHRIGQTKEVTVTRFRMTGTVEDKIYQICARKKEAADGALGVTGAQSLGRKKLSLNELMQIFGGAAEGVMAGKQNAEVAEAARNILNFQENLVDF